MQVQTSLLLCAVVSCVFGLACGPSTVDPADGTSTTESTSVSTSDGTGTADSFSATDTGQSTGPGVDTTAVGSSTGEDWLFGPGMSYVEVSCDEPGVALLFLELYIEEPEMLCVPDPAVDFADLVVAGLQGWDGQAGVYEVGEGTDFQATFGSGIDPLVGTVELFVSAPFVPERMILDLSNEAGEFVGEAELTTCGPAEAPPMCE